MRTEVNTDNMTGARLGIALVCALYEDKAKPSEVKKVLKSEGFSEEYTKTMLDVLFDSPDELMPLVVALNKKEFLSADDITDIIEDFAEGLSNKVSCRVEIH